MGCVRARLRSVLEQRMWTSQTLTCLQTRECAIPICRRWRRCAKALTQRHCRVVRQRCLDVYTLLTGMHHMESTRALDTATLRGKGSAESHCGADAWCRFQIDSSVIPRSSQSVLVRYTHTCDGVVYITAYISCPLQRYLVNKHHPPATLRRLL